MRLNLSRFHFMSDLHLLYRKTEMRAQLADILMEIPTEIASLSEWNDALHYLTGISGAMNEEQAKNVLINHLRTDMTQRIPCRYY